MRTERCLRCLLLVMCTHPFAKKALTPHLARSEGHERYFGCNLMHRKVLASSHQHVMAEAPAELRAAWSELSTQVLHALESASDEDLERRPGADSPHAEKTVLEALSLRVS